MTNKTICEIVDNGPSVSDRLFKEIKKDLERIVLNMEDILNQIE